MRAGALLERSGPNGLSRNSHVLREARVVSPPSTQFSRPPSPLPRAVVWQICDGKDPTSSMKSREAAATKRCRCAKFT
eukprot:1835868-Heterocapsa_arctica.AAC.1